MKDRFLFRDELESDEKADRITSSHFDWSIPLVKNTAIDAGISEDDIGNKGEVIHLFKSELDSSQYDEFIDELFQKYGKRGSQFNFQLYNIEGGFSIDDFVDSAEQYCESTLNDEVEMTFSRKIRLLEFDHSPGGNAVDLLFFVEGTPESDLAGEFEVVEDGEARELVDVSEISNEALLYRSTEYYIEVKIYVGYGMIAISNSEGSDELRDKIVNMIERWGDGNE